MVIWEISAKHCSAAQSQTETEMNRLLRTILVFAILMAFPIKSVQAQKTGVTKVPLQTIDVPSMPSKAFHVQRMTYAPGGQNPKHYHTSHVVFYVLEGTGVWQEEGKEAVTLKPGDTLQAHPGMIHSHRNTSSSKKLVFLEFVIVDKSQRSTVPMP